MSSSIKTAYNAQKYKKFATNPLDSVASIAADNFFPEQDSKDDMEKLKSPLLENDTDDETYDEHMDGEGTSKNGSMKNPTKKLSTKEWFKLIIVGGVSATGVITCLYAVGVTEATVCYVLASITGVTAPVTVYNQTLLAMGETKRFFIQHLQKEANRLGVANDELHNEVNNLKEKSDGLRDVEAKLNKITRRQGRTVDAFVDMVKTNGNTLKSMRKNVTFRLQQILIRVVLSCDKNKDFIIDNNEVEELILRLEQIDGCVFDPIKFRHDVSLDPRVGSVLTLVKNSIGVDPATDNQPVYTLSEGSQRNLRRAINDDTALGQALKF